MVRPDVRRVETLSVDQIAQFKREGFLVLPAVLDPELTLSQPASVTGAAGFDAIAHAVETAVRGFAHAWAAPSIDCSIATPA